MPRRHTHASAPRTKLIFIRVTEDDHAQFSIQARRFGMTLAGLCERLVTTGDVRVVLTEQPALHPALVAELKRLGNNINQIAHALHGANPPPPVSAVSPV
jgi:Bacterial mobilisation protein (MobC)